MEKFAYFKKILQTFCNSSCCKLTCLGRTIAFFISCFYRFVILQVNPFFLQFGYFISLSFVGFWILNSSTPKNVSFSPRKLDLFFTSVSASTVSSMSTVEMEVFSNTQLIILTILMFLGGEVFTSMVGLFLQIFKLKKVSKLSEKRVASFSDDDLRNSNPTCNFDQIELGMIHNSEISSKNIDFLKYYSVKFLGFVVLGYLVLVHFLGFTLASLYLTLTSSARNVLKKKKLKLFTFSIFTIVSTFSSCGFVPTNENMMVFSQNSGLLFILIPQILLGTTLFPSSLRLCVRVLGKFVKKDESNFLLKNTSEVEYHHWLPSLHASFLVPTVVGFLFIQFIMICFMEWHSDALSGLHIYQKIVGIFFQSANSRHTGETIFDLSIMSPAILVLFVVMMYLPPYTSFLPINHFEERKKKSVKLTEKFMFSQLSYLAIFIILICITEREKMKEDPLNFNVFNIVVEVISAYGNVGFSIGYSCERRLKVDEICKNKWYGFAGKWSDQGKIILILVMFFGRLKKYNINGAKMWILM